MLNYMSVCQCQYVHVSGTPIDTGGIRVPWSCSYRQLWLIHSVYWQFQLGPLHQQYAPFNYWAISTVPMWLTSLRVCVRAKGVSSPWTRITGNYAPSSTPQSTFSCFSCISLGSWAGIHSETTSPCPVPMASMLPGVWLSPSQGQLIFTQGSPSSPFQTTLPADGLAGDLKGVLFVPCIVLSGSSTWQAGKATCLKCSPTSVSSASRQPLPSYFM